MRVGKTPYSTGRRVTRQQDPAAVLHFDHAPNWDLSKFLHLLFQMPDNQQVKNRGKAPATPRVRDALRLQTR
jgi:hypothetical protein